MRRLSTEIIFKILFSVIFWFLWVIFPILNALFDNDQERLTRIIHFLPLDFLAVPFFYLNAEYLSRKYLLKSKWHQYFIGLALVFVGYLVSYVYLRAFIRSNISASPIRFFDSWNFFIAIFNIGMSTLYGFILLLLAQKRGEEERKEERMRSELSFLRSQISPHFIFNILNSIVYFIRTNSKLAEDVTIELSKLIRYMLYDSENKQVPLEKEIEYLENYIGLQKLRFGEDVDIQTNVGKNASGLAIEPMLLIPFVENAFKHGVGSQVDPFIKISLDISDGNEMEFRVVNRISEAPQEESKDSSSGIGIKNVRRRIELLYPSKHRLELRSDNNIFDVYLKLPLKTLVK